jgi:hypothetical protein
MKIKPMKKDPEKIRFQTRATADGRDGASILPEWWKETDERKLAAELDATASYLKTCQTYRIRQLAVSIRLYCGLSVYSYAGSNVSQMDRTKSLPDDRPTFNLIQACTDTLVSRATQDQPQPKFLTDGADYKQRHLGQELNQFIAGEFYQTKSYDKIAKIIRDGIVMGTGALKVYRGNDDKVCVDRVMITDLYCDDNDSLNGTPQQLIQLKLVDRNKLFASNPDAMARSIIAAAPTSYPDNSPDSGRTTADQILVIEGWRLASGSDPETKGYIPGRHTIAVVNGILFDEEYRKDKFPFVFFKYSDPFLGFWGQGLGTQLFGTQLSINRIMYTIARAINLVGVPRVFIEQGSKVAKAHNNNEIGVIVTYHGTKPSYEVAPCNAPELYAERDRLIQYGFQQCGVSQMSASSQKPAGLESAEAIRTFEDVNDVRFSKFLKKCEQISIDLAYLITEEAMEIAKDTGHYQTVYPNKDGTKQIDLPKMGLIKDTFVIQCFSESSLPRSPAGRIATITEQVQAGMLAIKEGRRLMRYPDLEQNERLDNASEERIFKILDEIIEESKYTPPDPYMDLQLAQTLTVQYYNLYMSLNLEESKADLLRTFFNQIQTLLGSAQAAMQPPPAPTPTANPMPAPVSPLVPNTNAPMAA